MRSEESHPAEGIDWQSYAAQMDLMADLMPAYSDNLNSLLKHISDRRLTGRVSILDLGAGTGNYCLAIANALPDSRIVHVDSNAAMNEIARRKYDAAGLTNIEIQEEHIQRLAFAEKSFDLIVCVNVLYAVPPQKPIAANIRRWLKSDGTFFIIDFGRKQSAVDWGLHFLWNAIKGRNVRKYFQFLVFGQQITRQAVRGRKSQETGSYWTHTTAEFQLFLEEVGFHVVELRPCHRDYADLAICSPISESK